MMLLFRVICAAAMVAGTLLAHVGPTDAHHDLRFIQLSSLTAAAAVGFVNLASRQGWGLVVAVVNGLWAGLIAIVLSALIYVVLHMGEAMMTTAAPDFSDFMSSFGSIVSQLLRERYYLGHLGQHLAATAVVGLVTEIIHWMLVHVRQSRSARRLHAADTGPKV